jgi:hypothetical protein
MLERVHLQPELAAFESLIKARVARLSAFEDERFARPTRVERDPATGELTVLAEFITGSRLSDLLDATADAAIVPGVDVALGYLLDTLPALTLLHSTDAITHGLIDASRTVLTPDGQIVFLDPVFGSAVERLGLSRQRLWSKYGIASPDGNGQVHLDPAADIAQVALGAVALVLGRNLQPEEYPEALPSLLMEVIEVAQIRGSVAFATGLQRFLQRSLPLPGRRPYVSADEAASDVRQLVRRDIGVDVCRQAVVDFATQMDAAFSTVAADDGSDADGSADRSTDRPAPGHSPRVPELDAFLDRFDHSSDAEHEARATETDHETGATEAHHYQATDPSAPAEAIADDANETELSLDNLDSDSPAPLARDVEEIYDLPPLDEVMAKATMLARPVPVPAPAPVYREPDPIPVEEPEPVVTPVVDDEYVADSADAADHFPVQEVVEELVAPEPLVPLDVAPHVEPPAAAVPLVDDAPPASIAATPAMASPAPVVLEPALEHIDPPQPAHEAAAAAELEAEAEPDKDSASSRRKKRQQQKSARARKDKLRSTTTEQKAPPAPVPEPPKPTSPTGWLVSPQRAAQFEAPVHVPRPMPAPPPVPIRPAPVAVPAVPSFTPTPVGPLPQPVYPSSVSASSGYGTSSAHQPAAPGPLAPPPIQVAPQPTAQVKIKAVAPTGFTPRRSTHAESQPVHVPADRFGTLGLGHGDRTADEEPHAFPWKLAAVAVAVAVIAIFLGRSYLPGRTAVSGEPGAVLESPAQTTAPPPAPADDSPIPAGRGRIVVVTQPPGIKVLLDRKAVGETPLRLDVTPGRRMLTFLTSGGEVIRSMRVAAGKTETPDIPVFSGWVAVFAPIVLQVAADGKSIGTTEQNRLMLPPGKHQLTLTNRELGYTATQEVEIEPGEVKTVNIEPRGTVNLNAIPWAEVWLDGQKLGDTPLAGTAVALGLREFVFKNPQFPERKVGATIKATANAPVVVDFTK